MKNLIDSLGISHRRFAELYNIPYNTVAQWYRGERNAPKWIKSLIEENIKLKAKEKKITFDDSFLFCNVIGRKDHKGELREWKTFFLEEEKANKEKNYFEEFNKIHPEQAFSIQRIVYIKSKPTDGRE